MPWRKKRNSQPAVLFESSDRQLYRSSQSSGFHKHLGLPDGGIVGQSLSNEFLQGRNLRGSGSVGRILAPLRDTECQHVRQTIVFPRYRVFRIFCQNFREALPRCGIVPIVIILLTLRQCRRCWLLACQESFSQKCYENGIDEFQEFRNFLSLPSGCSHAPVTSKVLFFGADDRRGEMIHQN